jgi:hypothetical protein
MADNDFIAPDIYSSENIEKFVNSRFAKNLTLSNREVAESYWKSELGINDDFFSPGFWAFSAAIESLPENLKKQDILQQIDLRPLLLAQKEYVTKNNYLPVGFTQKSYLKAIDKTIEIINNKYRSDAKIFIGNNGEFTDEETEELVDKFLKNTSEFSPTKIIADQTASRKTTTGGSDANYATTTGEPIIDEDGNININNIGNGLGSLSYEEYLQRYATSTIEDLLRLEDSGEVTTAEIDAGEFVANLTGKVSGTNGTTPVMWSLAQAKEYLWSLNPDKVADLQNSLRDAGYFDKLGAYPYEGDRDEATVLAWDLFLSDSLRNNQTPASRLQSASDLFAQRLASGQGNLFMDEADIEGAALALGTKVLSRGLDQQELTTLTDAVRNWERAAYKARSLGRGENGDIFSDTDITARINNYLKDTYAEEAVWTNYANSRQATERYFGN